jgi:macrolide transport system ATP-binding/permease protein
MTWSTARRRAGRPGRGRTIAATVPLASLSGGEKARVGLAALLLQAPDPAAAGRADQSPRLRRAGVAGRLSAETLTGALLVVSTTAVFLNRTVQAIVEIDETTRGETTLYSGSYDFFAHAKALARAKLG